jgi:lipopolysaccharide assembly protein A
MRAEMQTFVWIIRLFIVLVLVWFAVKNAQDVTLTGLPGQTWQAPLVFVLLTVFVGGVVIGLLAWVPTVVRQRREIARLRRAAVVPVVPAGPPTVPPEPEESSHGV